MTTSQQFSSQHHSFDILLASRYGIEEAILIHHFQHWVRINQFRKRNIRDGHCWTYQTRGQILDHFPYWNFDRVRRLCENLVKMGVLITANYNKNPVDKTLWYAFADETAFGVDVESSNNVYERQNCLSKGKIASGSPPPQTIYPPNTHTKTSDISYVGSEPPTCERPPLEDKIEEKKPLPAEAMDAANYLWSQVIKYFPKNKPPKLEKWAKEMDVMNRMDNRSWDDIRKLVDFAFEDAFWVRVIQSPTALRRSFDKISARMTPINNRGQWYEKNTEIARKIKNLLSKDGEAYRLMIYKNTVMFQDTSESINLDLPTETFEKIVLKWFGIKKNGGENGN